MRLCCADLVGDMCAVFGRQIFQHNKANRSITYLVLKGNEIGDKGACALADALRATLVTSFPHARPARASGHDKYNLESHNARFLCVLLTFGRAVFPALFTRIHMHELYRDINPQEHKQHLSTGSGNFLCGHGQICCVALAGSNERLILARAAPHVSEVSSVPRPKQQCKKSWPLCCVKR